MKIIYFIIIFILVILAIIIGIFIYWFYTPIDYSCNTNSDCTIKNVGNLCGAYPACVNKNFKPNPPELKDMVCGFPSIHECICFENRCINSIFLPINNTNSQK